MFSDWESLRQMLKRIRRLRTGLCAVVEIPEEGPVEIRQTFQRGHYTVWAAPEFLLACVVEVVHDESLQ